eukprot:gb/GECG01009092.1/.p1 GENE.gb/GECG01009092.1/~~gb/GECG01009092.1/.p1  ORF type:complete len:464 (+),score=55.22 gb/GECG01009092.1/:1-1392(+)
MIRRLWHLGGSWRSPLGPRSRAQFSTLADRIQQPRLDWKYVAENPDIVAENIRKRKSRGDPYKVKELLNERNRMIKEASRLRKERNDLSKSKTLSVEEKQTRVREIKSQLGEVEEQEETLHRQLLDEMLAIPNDTHEHVPIGSEDNSRVVKTYGDTPSFSFEPQDHISLGENLDIVDFTAAAAMAGSRFAVLKNDGVFLEFALIRWCLDILRDRYGFEIFSPPDMAHKAVVQSCGFNPRDDDAAQIYHLSGTDLCLSGTSEIQLMSLHGDHIFESKELPKRYAAVSHCFRHEAGSGGASGKGLYRLHQFSKVEMGIFCKPNESEAYLEHLRSIQEFLYEELGIPFRVLDMASEELGSSASRKYDIEAWMPARVVNEGDTKQGAYGEICSASNCTDYQARRLNMRYRDPENGNIFIHTLNGTACAVPRIIVAILENFQRADGSVEIPIPLQRYMGGKTEMRLPR